MINLYSIGDLSWSVFLPVSHFPSPGEILFVHGSERLLGNDAAVVSLLTARLGLRSCLLATNAISRRDGSPLLDLLQQEGVDVSLVNCGAYTTPVSYFLSLLNSDERSGLVEAYPFYHPPIEHLITPQFIYIDVYDEHMHDRVALLKLLSDSHARFLVNLSASNLLEKAHLLADVPSIDTLQMRGNGDVHDASALGSRMLQLCRVKFVLITLGEKGAVLVDQGSTSFIPAQSVHVVRTIGAGASFSTGFLFALAQGATHHEAALFASHYAALFCSLEPNPLEVFKR